jgi:hypothetical protein
MATLEWDKTGTRRYENGVDRGVLYLPDCIAVPWNGLTEINEQPNQKTDGIYFDGCKVNDFVTLGTFEASLKAITYPDELTDLEGESAVRRGVYTGEQRLKTFALCWRTQVGNDVQGNSASYKIHIVYNVTASPSDVTYASLSDDPELAEFEWDLTTVPNELSGYRSTSHLVIDSSEIDPWLLEDLEEILYGSSVKDPCLLPMDDLVDYMDSWCRVRVVDNGDGTWTATEHREGGNIKFLPNGEFKIVEINAVYRNDTVLGEVFDLSDTCDIGAVPTIDIDDNGDGTWRATASSDALIVVEPDGFFTIYNANAKMLNDTTYSIQDTYFSTTLMSHDIEEE